MEKYNFKMLNVMKLICAILVVMIHSMFLLSISEDLWVATSLGICRVAVPFFFVLSGYFFYNLKDENSRKKQIKKYALTYLKFVAMEVVILFPVVMGAIMRGEYLGLLLSLIFLGVTGSLWYISSMVIGLLFVKPFIKRNKYLHLIVISGLLFAFGLMGDAYAGIFAGTAIESATGLYKAIFGAMQIGFTCSIPFLTIGMLINRLELIEKFKNKKINLLLVGAFILLLVEAFVLYKNKIPFDFNMYISLLFAGPLLFIWTMQSKFNVSEKTSDLCKKLSLWVYVLHQPIMLTFSTLRLEFFSNTVFRFLITLALTVGISLILIKSQDKNKNKKRKQIAK